MSAASPPRQHSCTVGAPCWASLTTPDSAAAQQFYRTVLGWEFRSTELGEDFSVALSAGVPVGSLGGPTAALQVASDWTPYFSVSDVDATASRIVERSGTVAVGPVRLPLGRGALAADREGSRFGIWEGQLVADWESWRTHRPWRLELRASDVFASAAFYGEALEWACDRPGCCEVAYEDGSIALRSTGQVAARIVPAEPVPAGERRSTGWVLSFHVPDADAAAAEAGRHGGGIIGPATDTASGATLLQDPFGAVFGVTGDGFGSPAEGNDS